VFSVHINLLMIESVLISATQQPGWLRIRGGSGPQHLLAWQIVWQTMHVQRALLLSLQCMCEWSLRIQLGLRTSIKYHDMDTRWSWSAYSYHWAYISMIIAVKRGGNL
jgi:hypothetical protein